MSASALAIASKNRVGDFAGELVPIQQRKPVGAAFVETDRMAAIRSVEQCEAARHHASDGAIRTHGRHQSFPARSQPDAVA